MEDAPQGTSFVGERYDYCSRHFAVGDSGTYYDGNRDLLRVREQYGGGTVFHYTIDSGLAPATCVGPTRLAGNSRNGADMKDIEREGVNTWGLLMQKEAVCLSRLIPTV